MPFIKGSSAISLELCHQLADEGQYHRTRHAKPASPMLRCLVLHRHTAAHVRTPGWPSDRSLGWHCQRLRGYGRQSI
jgi:hypothetical protein